MSDESASVDVNQSPAVSTEDKVKMLRGWIELIQADVDAIQKVRDSNFDVYSKQKKTYDEWLAKRWKVIVRYDKKLKERKDQITEIDGEIKAIIDRPPPGILPELPVVVTPKRTKWRKPGAPKEPTTHNATEAVPEGSPTTYVNPDVSPKVEFATTVTEYVIKSIPSGSVEPEGPMTVLFSDEERAAMNREAHQS